MADIYRDHTLDDLFKLAQSGNLAEDFDRWEVCGEDGWTVAHAAARSGTLPDDYNQWDLSMPDGWTVAHAASVLGHLPKDFDQWELTDKNGLTVAHSAARCKHLPNKFDHWDLTDRLGKSVLEYALEMACGVETEEGQDIMKRYAASQARFMNQALGNASQDLSVKTAGNLLGGARKML